VNKQPNKNISAYENESATLCAVVSQERANVRWLKDGHLLNADNIHISSDGANHNLTINPLRLNNAGVYVCDVNTDEMSFTVIVKGKYMDTLSCCRFPIALKTSTSIELLLQH